MEVRFGKKLAMKEKIVERSAVKKD